MSAGVKIDSGSTSWQPEKAPTARPLPAEGSGSGAKRIVTDVTFQHVDPNLHRVSTDPDAYVGSPHFNALVNIFAAGHMPNLENMLKAGEYFNVTEITEPLMQNAALRGALAAAVQEKSGGRVNLVEVHPTDLGGIPVEEGAVPMAIDRPFGRVPFTIHSVGFEAHRKGR
jgi:hypothetical protein